MYAKKEKNADGISDISGKFKIKLPTVNHSNLLQN